VLLTRPGLALVAVFDGHGGDAAAHFCAERLAARLASAWPSGASTSAAADALRRCFDDLNRSFLESAGADDSGATALAALCMPDRLLVANAGDCRAVLWRGDALVPLTRDHTPSSKPEAERVRRAGGSIRSTVDGKPRVEGKIQVTRCIGDRPLRQFGLVSTPEIREEAICEHDKAVVLASDGLWDVVSNERVLHCLIHTAKSPDMIAKRLLAEAMERGTTDNTTVLVIFLKDLAGSCSPKNDGNTE
jgi:serine/threonine protein phosphatase PrpC